MDKVRCTYCGAEMIGQRESTGLVRGMDFMVCHKCLSRSPAIHTVDGNWDGKQACAYAAAMQRWQEPNRVLSLEEIGEMDAYSNLFVETNGVNPDNRGVFETSVACVQETLCDEDEDAETRKEYGVTIRFWLRRPTDEERAGAGWGNHDGGITND